jgi:hypothetical protein
MPIEAQVLNIHTLGPIELVPAQKSSRCPGGRTNSYHSTKNSLAQISRISYLNQSTKSLIGGRKTPAQSLHLVRTFTANKAMTSRGHRRELLVSLFAAGAESMIGGLSHCFPCSLF